MGKILDSKITVKLNKKVPKLLLLSLIMACLFTLSPKLLSLSYGFIDPSYNYAVNNAAASREAFGTEFISTYGPLSYLVANYLPQNIIKESLSLGFYAILLGSGVYIFTILYLKKSKSRIIALPILIYVLTISNGGESIEWCYLTLFILYCFILLKIKGNARLILMTSLAVLSAIFLLTKFTLGLGTILSLITASVLSIDERFINKIKFFILIMTAYIVTFTVLGRFLGITNPFAYLHTGYIESNNFSIAMSLYDSHALIATILIAISLCSLALWAIYNDRKISIKYLFIFPALLTIWKYSVVRQDAHLLRVIQVSVPIAFMIYYACVNKKEFNKWIVAFIVSGSIFAVWANGLPFMGYGGFFGAITAPISNIINLNPIKYFNVNQQKTEWSTNSSAGLSGAELPQSMLRRIGRGGVDIFPWETSIIAANNLKWNNRPSPFSFESYDPFLDNLNSSFFYSSKAPLFIVWHVTPFGNTESIDGRNILWDEPATLRAILSNYKLSNYNSHFMLLEKRTHKINIAKSNTYIGNLSASDKWIYLPNSHDRLLFGYFNVRYTLINKLKQEIVRGRQYFLSLNDVSGSNYYYRIVPENSTQGLLISGLPNSWQGLVELVKTHSNQLQENRDVYRIKLTAQRP
jgi:hypothetical protein